MTNVKLALCIHCQFCGLGHDIVIEDLKNVKKGMPLRCLSCKKHIAYIFEVCS